MKITILGGAGEVGSRIVDEALQRKHEVTAVSRKMSALQRLPTQTLKTVQDIKSIECVINASKGSDLIISALRPPEGHEELLAPLTEYVLHAAEALKIPAVIIGGAARLKIPEENSYTVLTMPSFLPNSIKPIASACQKQFDLCVQNTTATWSYISPPAMLLAGNRTGLYRLGTDTLVVDENGDSNISMEDFAVAVIDEAEEQNHPQQAFTVAY